MISPFVKPLLADIPLYAQQAPVAPASASPIQIVAPPDESHRREVTGPQVTTKMPTPETAQAFEDLAVANDRQAQAVQAQQPMARLAEEYEASVAQTDADRAALAEAEKREAMRQHQQKVQALTQEKERRRQDEEKAAKPTTYWEDKSVGARILAAFLVGLGAYASNGRGPNRALEIYQNAAAEDRQRKLDKYTKSVEFRKRAESDIEGARTALSDELANITQNEISRGNVLKKQLLSFAKRSGLPAAQARAEEMAAKIDAENAERMIKLGQYYDKTVQSGRVTESTTLNRTASKGGAPDLTALTKDGAAYGTWRTPREAEQGRDAQTALKTLGGAVEQLNAHIRQHGKLIDPTSKEYADRAAYGDAVSRELQTLQNAGVLNPGEYERNKKSVDTTLFKGGDAAISANSIMVDSAGRKYDAALQGKAVRLAPGPGPTPAAPSQAVTVPSAKPLKSPGQVVEKNGKRYQKGADGLWMELKP